MTQVSISDLKSRLSHYLREVRRGGEVQVLDRGVPVARLMPLPSQPEKAEGARRERLIQAGVLRPGKGNATWILETTPLDLPVSVSRSLQEDREDRV